MYEQQSSVDEEVVEAYQTLIDGETYDICNGKISGRKGHQGVEASTTQVAYWLLSPTEAMQMECKEAIQKLELVGSTKDNEGSTLLDVTPTVFTMRQNECIATEQAITALMLLEERPWSKGQQAMDEFVNTVQNIAQLQDKVVVPDLDNLKAPEDGQTVISGMPNNITEQDSEIAGQVEAMQVVDQAEQSTERDATATPNDERVSHTIENWRDYISKVYLHVYLQSMDRGVVLWGEHVIPGERDGWPKKVEAMTPREKGDTAGKLMEFLYGQCKPQYSVTTGAVPKELEESAATQTRQVSFTLTMEKEDRSKWLRLQQSKNAAFLNARDSEESAHARDGNGLEIRYTDRPKLPRQQFEAILSGAFRAMREVTNIKGGISKAVMRNKKQLEARGIHGAMTDAEIRDHLHITKTVMKGGSDGLAFSWLVLLDLTTGAQNRGTKHLLRTYMQRGNRGLLTQELRDPIAYRSKKVQPATSYEASISSGRDMGKGKARE